MIIIINNQNNIQFDCRIRATKCALGNGHRESSATRIVEIEFFLLSFSFDSIFGSFLIFILKANISFQAECAKKANGIEALKKVVKKNNNQIFWPGK